uniref:Uncharacterized protein n=1 Tax=Anguilla anguilla TaxID=7936 RepID=A0A0E9R2S6_ANGAN
MPVQEPAQTKSQNWKCSLRSELVLSPRGNRKKMPQITVILLL